MDIDKLLEKANLKYEDLTLEERETLNTWSAALRKGQLSISKVRDYIEKMKSSVEKKLSKSSLGSKEDTLLKARLRNYLLLEAFLTSPEKAKEALEGAISGMVRKI